jgi:hypothetical protein
VSVRNEQRKKTDEVVEARRAKEAAEYKVSSGLGLLAV